MSGSINGEGLLTLWRLRESQYEKIVQLGALRRQWSPLQRLADGYAVGSRLSQSCCA
jgi:hypothetical protein